MTPPRSRFLVVDDGDEDAFILNQLLERAGVTDRVWCRSAEMAMEWLASVDGAVPEAAFIDVRLPLRSGFDVLSTIRESAKLRAMRVVLLSASDEPRNLGKALQLGADAYMIKFPSLSVMRDVIAAIHAAVPGREPTPPLAVSGNLLVGAVAPGAKPD